MKFVHNVIFLVRPDDKVVFDPIALLNVETAENFDLDVLSQLVKVLLKLGMIVRKDQGLHI